MGGDVVAVLVRTKIVDDVRSGRILLAFLPWHRPSRQWAVLGRGEETERVPAMLPCAARIGGRIEDYEAHTRAA